MIQCKKYNSTHTAKTCLARISAAERVKDRSIKYWANLNMNAARYKSCLECEVGRKIKGE